MQEYISRDRVDRVRYLLRSFPAVGLFGPRQVGKTTLVRDLLPEVYDRPLHYLDLEDAGDFAKLDDARQYLSRYEDVTVVIDEVQVRPEIFTRLRPLIDAKRVPGRFILLGSASPTIVRGVSESLAGRIAYVSLGPIDLLELPAAYDQQRHWIRGGFPDSLLAPDLAMSWEWRTSFLDSYVGRDLVALRQRMDPLTSRRLLSMCAHLHGELLNMSSLSKSLGVTAPTVGSYLDVLEETFVVRRLQPYYVNTGKRLTKSPKLYIQDSGLFHRLQNLYGFDDIYGSPKLGADWEGYVVAQVSSVLPPRYADGLYFYRTAAGAEMDLVIMPAIGRTICIEVKVNNAPTLSKGFYNAIEDLAPVRTYVVTPEQEEVWLLREGVYVIGLLALLRILSVDPFADPEVSGGT